MVWMWCIAAKLVDRRNKIFLLWDFFSIFMQTLWTNFLLFCLPTWRKCKLPILAVFSVLSNNRPVRFTGEYFHVTSISILKKGDFWDPDRLPCYIWSHNVQNKNILITKDLEKHFRTKSSEIKTWRFGDDISPLSNVNDYKFSNVTDLIIIYIW